MSVSFCVSNLPADVTDDAIRELFEPLAPVTDIRRVVHPETNEFTRKATVKLKPEGEQSKTDLVRTIHTTFNGHSFGNPWLIVTLMYAAPASAVPGLSDSQREAVQRTLETLGESEEIPTHQVTMMMRMFGDEFVSHVLSEAQTIEEAGGMMVQDGSRRRTFGGVFFYLARQYIRGSAWPMVFDVQRVKSQLEADKSPSPKSPKAALSGGAPKKLEKAKPKKAPRPRPSGPALARAPEPATAEPVYQAPVVEREPLDEETLRTLRAQVADLQRELETAEQDLTAAKAGKLRPKEGVFALIKRVADLKREIDRLQRTYPELSE